MTNETTAVATTTNKQSVLVALGQRYSVDPAKLLDTLKGTVFKNASNEQLMALCIVANEYKLNPFLKQIYAFPDKGGGIIPVVGVDGWISLINSQPGFDGVEFTYEEAEGKAVSVTAIIHVKNRAHPCKVTEYMSECQRNTDPWNKSPRRMLRHRALIQCGRVAFGLGGIIDEEEADFIKNVTPQDAKPQPSIVVKETATEIIVEAAPIKSSQDELSELVIGGGYTFDDFAKWGSASGNLEQDFGGFNELPDVLCKRLLKAKSGMLKQLAAAKEMTV